MLLISDIVIVVVVILNIITSKWGTCLTKIRVIYHNIATSFANKLNIEYFTWDKLKDIFNIYIYVFVYIGKSVCWVPYTCPLWTVKADDVRSLLHAAMPATQILPVATRSALLMSPMLPVSPQSNASSPTYVPLSDVWLQCSSEDSVTCGYNFLPSCMNANTVLTCKDCVDIFF